MVSFIIAVISAAVTGGIVYFITTQNKGRSMNEEEAIKLASKKAKDILLQAEKKGLQIKNKVEEELKELRSKLNDREQQLIEQEKLIEERGKRLNSRSTQIDKMQEKIQREKEAIQHKKEELQKELEKVSSLTRDEAQKLLMKSVEEELQAQIAKKIKNAENKAEEEATRKAKSILIDAMQQCAIDYVAETTTSVIELSDENMKGRIIGKDGRNIRAFEMLTGVDVIIDESPNSIAVSSYDPLRREIAAIAMRRLIKDGRIHPGRIEDIVAKVKKEISEEIMKYGRELADAAKWHDIDVSLIKILGKMKYRTSYGQNLMQHTLEVMKLGELIAKEVDADVSLVRKACLLHDVGKLYTHKMEGAHHHISGKIARKYNLPEKLVNAIEAHHGDIEPQSIEAVIVSIADAISGARPGARKESYENYVQRIKSLEDAANKVGKDKIDSIYAIHAGRELRVIVKPQKIDDKAIIILANKIARAIEKNETYPGTVQVTVIRETRATDIAK